jgi:hypothetical protein
MEDSSSTQTQADVPIKPPKPVSPLAKLLIDSLVKKEEIQHDERKISVNPIVTKFASWYERLRNAM